MGIQEDRGTEDRPRDRCITCVFDTCGNDFRLALDIYWLFFNSSSPIALYRLS